MGFTNINKKAVPKALQGVTMMLRGRQTVIAFGADVTEQAGLKHGGGASIAVGYGADAGTLAICDDKNGFSTHSRNGKSKTLTCSTRTAAIIGEIHTTGRKKFNTTKCNYIFRNGMLIVEIPRDFISGQCS